MAAGERPNSKHTPLRRRRPPPWSGPQYFSLTALSSVRPGGPRASRLGERDAPHSPGAGRRSGSANRTPGFCSSPGSGRSTPNMPPPRGMLQPRQRPAEEAGASPFPPTPPRGPPPRMPQRQCQGFCVEASGARPYTAPFFYREASPGRSDTSPPTRRFGSVERTKSPVWDYIAECRYATDNSPTLSPSPSYRGAAVVAQGPASPSGSADSGEAPDWPAQGAPRRSRRRSLSEPPACLEAPPPTEEPTAAYQSVGPLVSGPPPNRRPVGMKRMSNSPRRSPTPSESQSKLRHLPGRRLSPYSSTESHSSLVCRKQRGTSGASSCDLRRPPPRVREARMTPSPRSLTATRPPC